MKLYNNALPENLGKRAEVKTEFGAHKGPENRRKLAEDKRGGEGERGEEGGVRGRGRH